MESFIENIVPFIILFFVVFSSIVGNIIKKAKKAAAKKPQQQQAKTKPAPFKETQNTLEKKPAETYAEKTTEAFDYEIGEFKSSFDNTVTKQEETLDAQDYTKSSKTAPEDFAKKQTSYKTFTKNTIRGYILNMDRQDWRKAMIVSEIIRRPNY